jgi:SWI/SNF-related matrix-associated actin-dependent regulator 1 of chromatin subfamily A
MFRKRKEDVLKDLPKKRKIIVPFALDNTTKKQYDKASESFVEWVTQTENKKMADGKRHIETLRQLAYIGKRDGTIEWISNFLDSGDKLVVFAWHTDAIDDIHNAFKKVSVVVDGRTSSVQKQANIDAFQTDPEVKLFIGQITAAGIGINLTAASSLAIVEFPWTPGDLEQAMGRIDRIGQKSPVISFYYLVGAGTVDEDTAMLLDEKSEMLDKTLDGKKHDEIFGVDIVEMLSNLYEHKGE